MNTKLLAVILLAGFFAVGCANKAAVGTAAGVGAAGVGYEVYNKKRLDDNEDDFREGKITREEYEDRKDEIEDRSVVY